jgi:hypothetical protein
MTSLGFAALKAINNTRVIGENIEFYTYWQNLNGYGRVLAYEAFGNQTCNKTGELIEDPHNSEMNRVYGVTEGYFNDGFLSKEPHYGRIYLEHDGRSSIKVGFTSYVNENRLETALYGKGIVYNTLDHTKKEGIFNDHGTPVRE